MYSNTVHVCPAAARDGQWPGQVGPAAVRYVTQGSPEQGSTNTSGSSPPGGHRVRAVCALCQVMTSLWRCCNWCEWTECNNVIGVIRVNKLKVRITSLGIITNMMQLLDNWKSCTVQTCYTAVGDSFRLLYQTEEYHEYMTSCSFIVNFWRRTVDLSVMSWFVGDIVWAYYMAFACFTVRCIALLELFLHMSEMFTVSSFIIWILKRGLNNNHY